MTTRSKADYALLFCAVAISAVIGAQDQEHPAVKAQTTKNSVERPKPSDTVVFDKIRPTLLAKTNVPLRLPSFIPCDDHDDDKDSCIYAILRSVELASYDIQLAVTEDCEGGNACHYGEVRGSATHLTEENRKRWPVKLLNGVKGYFIDFTCGAHCDDATVGWTEGGFYYSISMKAEDKAILIKIANSAINGTQKK